MIFRHFPDHTRPDFNLDAPCPLYGWPNMIIHARGTDVVYPEHLGPLSIKCAFGGREIYETGNSRHVVDDNAYLLLNKGQPYSSVIQSDAEVETFCVFFRAGLAEEVHRGVAVPSAALLDDPERESDVPVIFADRLYGPDTDVWPALLGMRAALHEFTPDSNWFEEQLRELLARLLRAHGGTDYALARIPAARGSTRLEIYRRLERARAFIGDSLTGPLDLAQMAAVACLSSHHFLRLFKQAYGLTPHQYVTQRRIERAQEMLRHTDLPVQEICWSVGFESVGSFSLLFRRRIGLPPDSFRRAVRNDRKKSIFENAPFPPES